MSVDSNMNSRTKSDLHNKNVDHFHWLKLKTDEIYTLRHSRATKVKIKFNKNGVMIGHIINRVIYIDLINSTVK